MDLLFPEPVFRRLSEHLLASRDHESAALVLLRIGNRGGRKRVLAYDVVSPSPRDYLERTATSVTLRPEFYVPWIGRAANDSHGVAFAHSHPWTRGLPSFSKMDDAGETALSQ